MLRTETTNVLAKAFASGSAPLATNSGCKGLEGLWFRAEGSGLRGLEGHRAYRGLEGLRGAYIRASVGGLLGLSGAHWGSWGLRS